MNTAKLKQFLIKAKKNTYASGGENKAKVNPIKKKRIYIYHSILIILLWFYYLLPLYIFIGRLRANSVFGNLSFNT